MQKTITLSEYVKKRNGVPLGASGSMANMLERSLCADSFYIFWRYWNPIWSYYLSRYAMKPLSRFLPTWLATILTFAISGALHDLAVMLVKWKLLFFFTPWFVFMGVVVWLSKVFRITYAGYHWALKLVFNVTPIVGCFIGVQSLF